MKLSRTHLEAIVQDGREGEIDVARHPTKPIVIMEIKGTAIMVGMTPEQVDHLVAKLQWVRGHIQA